MYAHIHIYRNILYMILSLCGIYFAMLYICIIYLNIHMYLQYIYMYIYMANVEYQTLMHIYIGLYM